MKDIFAEIKSYLPKYLSPDAQTALFGELDKFPDNIDSRLYSSELRKDKAIYQGDAIAGLTVINLPVTETKLGNCLVLSNTCDIDPSNKSDLPPRLSYCPIIRFSKLEEIVRSIRKADSASAYLTAVRTQTITSMFYLPKGDLLDEDSVALLSHPLNCACNEKGYETFSSQKLVTLSDYGFYLFLFKLAIHFTRIADSVARTPAPARPAEDVRS